MNIEFDNTGLEELYTWGATKDNRYKRLSKDIVKRYIKGSQLHKGSKKG